MRAGPAALEAAIPSDSGRSIGGGESMIDHVVIMSAEGAPNLHPAPPSGGRLHRGIWQVP